MPRVGGARENSLDRCSPCRSGVGGLEAQSLNYRDPSIPRAKDGRPNLSAPAPRLNGKPDLSGAWQAERAPVSEFVRVLGPGLPAIQPDLNDITKQPRD
jgi:hypothetical protein